MSIDLAAHRHIHFVGIAGAGMSALARLLHARGYVISGSDRTPGDVGVALIGEGIKVYDGHSASSIRGSDLVVVTSAVRGGNAEVDAARADGIPVIKRADLLAAIANRQRCIAVAGTHGKTTTTALITHILAGAGLDPSAIIGGTSASLGSNARAGTSDLIVVEADEYDSTFLGLLPSLAVITNVAAEHLDYYGSEQRVRAAFSRFAAGVRDRLFLCADDAGLPEIALHASVPITWYGIRSGEWCADDICEDASGTAFTLHYETSLRRCHTVLGGHHNVRNATAALAVAHALGVSIDRSVVLLSSFGGVRRRSEVRGESAHALVIDDYAVHPTEVRVTLGALKRRYGRPLRVIFQPHTYSRLSAFMDDFVASFADADAVYIMDVYAARETNTLGLSGSDLADRMSSEHHRAIFTGPADATVERVLEDVRPGDVVVTMGAGDVTRLGPRVLQGLAVKR